jgi:hypothetical protein
MKMGEIQTKNHDWTKRIDKLKESIFNLEMNNEKTNSGKNENELIIENVRANYFEYIHKQNDKLEIEISKNWIRFFKWKKHTSKK